MTHSIHDRLIVWRDFKTLAWVKVKRRKRFSFFWCDLPESEWPKVEGSIEYRYAK